MEKEKALILLALSVLFVFLGFWAFKFLFPSEIVVWIGIALGFLFLKLAKSTLKN